MKSNTRPLLPGGGPWRCLWRGCGAAQPKGRQTPQTVTVNGTGEVKATRILPSLQLG